MTSGFVRKDQEPDPDPDQDLDQDQDQDRNQALFPHVYNKETNESD